MEPEDTPLEEEKISSKPSFSGSMLIFGGVLRLDFLGVGAMPCEVFSL